MMIDLERDCEMITLSEEELISCFDCGDADLNDFFNNDALNYKRQMLSPKPPTCPAIAAKGKRTCSDFKNLPPLSKPRQLNSCWTFFSSL